MSVSVDRQPASHRPMGVRLVNGICGHHLLCVWHPGGAVHSLDVGFLRESMCCRVCVCVCVCVGVKGRLSLSLCVCRCEGVNATTTVCRCEGVNATTDLVSVVDGARVCSLRQTPLRLQHTNTLTLYHLHSHLLTHSLTHSLTHLPTYSITHLLALSHLHTLRSPNH